MAPTSRAQSPVGLGFPYAVALAWVGYFGALQWSVVRFRVPIVVVLTLCTIGLAAWQVWRPGPFRLTGVPAAVALGLSALVTVTVPLFSYLPAGAERAAAWSLAGAAAMAAVLVLRPDGNGQRPRVVATVSAAAYVLAGATAVVTDPAPRIDVWVTLQQAADALAQGENFYAMSWTGSPGIQDAFTYLPWTVVLLAPGRWVAGDVRWALLAYGLVAAAGLLMLGRSHGAIPVALLLLAPGTLTQLDQAWTEPLLLAGLVWWAVLLRRGHAWWAVLPLAMACASKQHLAALLPVLLVWRPFGWHRAVATGGLAGVLMLPWVMASPTDFMHDTVSLLVSFHPIKFANTLYLLALNEYGITPPFWLTGLAVVGTLAGVVVAVWRRQPDLSEMLRWLALVLLVANLVNKQAFYNQFWLAAALLAASLAASAVGVNLSPAATPGPARYATTGWGGWRRRRYATRSGRAG